MNPSDFITKKRSGDYCAYLSSTLRDREQSYSCGSPQPRELADVYFPEPCSTETWNNCPLNIRVSYEELYNIVKSSGFPKEGEAWDIEMPANYKQIGQKWVVEHKEGKIKFFKTVIYQRSNNQPPKTVTVEILPKQ